MARCHKAREELPETNRVFSKSASSINSGDSVDKPRGDFFIEACAGSLVFSFSGIDTAAFAVIPGGALCVPGTVFGAAALLGDQASFFPEGFGCQEELHGADVPWLGLKSPSFLISALPDGSAFFA